MTCADDDREHRFRVLLGEELRRLRERRCWTLRQLHRRLGLDVSIETIATWERGTRRCSAVCVWQVCEVFEEPVDELFGRVLRRLNEPEGHGLENEPEQHGLKIDLRSVASITSSELGPLQRWAKLKLDAYSGAARYTVVFTSSTLDRMTQLCRLETAEFVELLRQAGLILDD